MSVAAKCDRCGKLYEPIESGLKHRPRISYEDMYNELIPIRYYDLCPDCDKTFKAWVEGK